MAYDKIIEIMGFINKNNFEKNEVQIEKHEYKLLLNELLE